MSVEFTPGAQRRRVVLWRHGRTEWNDSRRFQGQTDVALDDVGRAQAAVAAEQLATLNPQVILASDLSRAAETAQALADLLDVAVRRTPALRETHGGSWEGRYADDLKADPRYVAWLAGDDVPAGGSETRSQVGDRAVVAVRDAVAGLDAGGLAVVASHGGTIRAVIGRMLDLPVDHWRVLGGLANCCWSVLEEGRTGWRLVEHNAGSLPQVVLGDDR
ncbi:MAG: histidine phosphatase family protein [Actinomycetia bacterium]|nr:histidine phosphatase family protein [Actinomycetes bacterium]